jgi:hypothetical protein
MKRFVSLQPRAESRVANNAELRWRGEIFASSSTGCPMRSGNKHVLASVWRSHGFEQHLRAITQRLPMSDDEYLMYLSAIYSLEVGIKGL